MDNNDFQAAIREKEAARGELLESEREFERVSEGVARSVGFADGIRSSGASASTFQAISEYLMNALRECADRHQRAADLVAPDDVEEMTKRLKEEQALWVGEGGAEFAAYLEKIGYQPQKIAAIKKKKEGKFEDSYGETDDEEQQKEDFSPLDQVHDAVLNIRDDEMRIFFSTAEEDKPDPEPDNGRTETVGSAHFGLECLRHMAEQTESEVPVFSTGSGRTRVGTLAVDVVPIAEDGSYPPFDNTPEKNPFVQNSDELLGRMARFAVRVRSVKFDGEEEQQGIVDRIAAFAATREIDPLSVDMFVRYRLPSQLRPNVVETHPTKSQREGLYCIDHIAQWDKLVDEEFLDELSTASITFELVFEKRKTLEEMLAASAAEPTAAAAAAALLSDPNNNNTNNNTSDKLPTPRSLRELISVRLAKHQDLKLQLDAEIVREVEESARRREERERFVAEFRSAHADDMKHIKRAVDRMRPMVREGVHHKNRGTAKQMTAERLVAERERRNDVRRKMDEKLYNAKCASNHGHAMEMQNLASEIHNLKRRKEATQRECERQETESKRLADASEKILSDAILMRDALNKELNVIARIRSDVGVAHHQARRQMFSTNQPSPTISGNGSSSKTITEKK